MAEILASGDNLPQDEIEALRWYRAAAEQGSVYYQNLLAMAHEFGRGVPHDYAEAVRWSFAAAEQGFDPARGPSP